MFIELSHVTKNKGVRTVRPPECFNSNGIASFWTATDNSGDTIIFFMMGVACRKTCCLRVAESYEEVKAKLGV